MTDPPAAGAPSLREVQDRVAEYWGREDVPARVLARAGAGPTFWFTEGPPTANGAPHMGHLIARTVKDLQLRYHRMRGDRIVSAVGGWDCHGLPVELEIEKRHGFKSKREIESYGVEKFCDECRASTLQVADVWRSMSGQLGYWLNYDRAYRTMDASYIESVWWSLKTLFDKGLLEKGHYVLPYCPRCETPLASHEVAQGYAETTDPSVTVRFPLVGSDPPRDLLVWTTTPWTLPANLLVAVRADLEYSVVRTDGGDLVLATAAVPRYFPDPPSVVERVSGASLAGRTYAPPFDSAGPGPGRYRIVLDEFVTADEGTGVVHIAPSFGPDDQRVGAREKVGVFDPLDSRGVFGPLVPLVTGKKFKAADPILTEDLAGRNRLFRAETIRHTYPFCWRCANPLLYRAIDSWFVRTSRLTEKLVRYNATVRWVPDHLRDGRFGNFLTEAKDWALSRSRYWGTPLPIWMCPDGHAQCVGSFGELGEKRGQPLPPDFDPHRTGVDPIVLPCPTCGRASRREPYTIDVWYDSGAAPFARFHYPFEASDFDPAAPLDYAAEGIDMTRGWFYTLLVVATAVFDRPAYRTCLATGMVLHESGGKMSKSKGNVLDPMVALANLGGDPIRWMFLSTDFTEPMRVSEAVIHKASAHVLGTLANLVVFHRENARADGLAPPTDRPVPEGLLDRWVLSRLEGTRAAVENSLDSFDPRPGVLAVRTFIDDVSTWYVRRSRPRFWGATSPDDRAAAHATLSYTLDSLATVIAPFLPHYAEWVHHEVAETGFRGAATSVHLARWPAPLAPRDPELEEAMDEVRRWAEVGRAMRHRAGVKARIPLAELVLFGEPTAGLTALGPEGERLLADELNVRTVRRAAEYESSAYPASDWELTENEVGVAAALSRTPTPELLAEGLVREVARRLQQARKELALRPTDHVDATIGATGDLLAALVAHRSELAVELLADGLEIGPALADGPDVRRWDIDGIEFSARLVPRKA